MKKTINSKNNICVSPMDFKPCQHYEAVVCDLDGTLLHSQKEAIAVQGRTMNSFLGEKSAHFLAEISKIFPVVIATGRNAVSTDKMVKQLIKAKKVKFSGFVLENGFVIKKNLADKIVHNDKWDKIAELFPDWERLPFYENCVGFIPPSLNQEKMAGIAEKKLKDNGYTDLVYKEKRKLFIYPGSVDKMRGLSLLGVHPYIAMGDQTNDISMIKNSTWPVIINSDISELKEIVKKKNGFCSLLTSHEAAQEMLSFAYEKIKIRFDQWN